MSVSGLKVIGKSESTLTLEWSSNIQSQVANFYVFYVHIDNVYRTTVNYTSSPHVYVLRGLQPETEYSITVTIYRVDGNGDQRELPSSSADVQSSTTVTTTPTTITDHHINMADTNKGIIVAAGAVIILILINTNNNSMIILVTEYVLYTECL